MRGPLQAWLVLGAIFEVVALATIAVAYVFDAMSADEAQSWAVKLTIAAVVVVGAGAVIAALVRKSSTGAGA